MSFINWRLTVGRKFLYQNAEYVIKSVFNLPNGEWLIYFDNNGKSDIVNAHEIELVEGVKEK
jgi:hypothetical protein